MDSPLVDPIRSDHHNRCRRRPTQHDVVEPVPGGRGELLGVVEVREIGMDPGPQHTRRHDERPRARPAPGLIDAGYGTETTPTQCCFECEPTFSPRHPYPTGTDPVHPALMSGVGIVPIRLKGRMMACTLPMTLLCGTVPWNSSPIWKRESAELFRLSPITQ